MFAPPHQTFGTTIKQDSRDTSAAYCTVQNPSLLHGEPAVLWIHDAETRQLTPNRTEANTVSHEESFYRTSLCDLFVLWRWIQRPCMERLDPRPWMQPGAMRCLIPTAYSHEVYCRRIQSRWISHKFVPVRRLSIASSIVHRYKPFLALNQFA